MAANSNLSPNERTASAFEPYADTFASLVGEKTTRVSIDQWSVTLLFNTAKLFIEGEWLLKNKDGLLVDQSQELERRGNFDLWRITGQTIESFEFLDQPVITLIVNFSGGWRLIVEANDDGYEDWALSSVNNKDYWIVCNGTL